MSGVKYALMNRSGADKGATGQGRLHPSQRQCSCTIVAESTVFAPTTGDFLFRRNEYSHARGGPAEAPTSRHVRTQTRPTEG